MFRLPVFESKAPRKSHPAENHAVGGVAVKSATSKKLVTLSDLEPGTSGRVVRVGLTDVGCRRRFAEMGISEGMTVSVITKGDTMILGIGGGRMGVSADCASQVTVLRI